MSSLRYPQQAATHFMTLLLYLYLASGLFMSLLSLPMILGWLNPNPYYGFRVQQTLEDPAVWRAANRYAGWRLCVAGLVIAAAAGAFYFLPGQKIDWYAYQCLGVTAVALGWAVLSSFLFLWQLPRSAETRSAEMRSSDAKSS